MHAAEIVISEPKRDRRGVVLNFLRKRIGQTCETPYAHPHAEILALHKRCAYVLRIGIAHDGFHFTTDTGCRTVPPLVWRRAKNLNAIAGSGAVWFRIRNQR